MNIQKKSTAFGCIADVFSQCFVFVFCDVCVYTCSLNGWKVRGRPVTPHLKYSARVRRIEDVIPHKTAALDHIPES